MNTPRPGNLSDTSVDGCAPAMRSLFLYISVFEWDPRALASALFCLATHVRTGSGIPVWLVDVYV